MSLIVYCVATDDGMVCSIAVDGQAVIAHRYRGRLLRLVVQSQGKGRLGTQADDDSAVGRRDEVIGRDPRTASQIGVVGRCVGEVKPSGISRNGGAVAIVEDEFAQGLVLLAAVALHLQHALLGRLIVLEEQRFANAC